MVQANAPAVTRQRMNGILSWLEEEWRDRVPEYAEAWERWTEDEKLVFVSEATIRDDRLHQAREWRRQRLLSPAQAKKLQCIEELVAKNRPLLQPLLDED